MQLLAIIHLQNCGVDPKQAPQTRLPLKTYKNLNNSNVEVCIAMLIQLVRAVLKSESESDERDLEIGDKKQQGTKMSNPISLGYSPLKSMH